MELSGLESADVVEAISVVAPHLDGWFRPYDGCIGRVYLRRIDSEFLDPID